MKRINTSGGPPITVIELLIELKNFQLQKMFAAMECDREIEKLIVTIQRIEYTLTR